MERREGDSGEYGEVGKTPVRAVVELIGDDPEAAEAALLQAYPGRDPIKDVLTGKITLRRFRVMLEHLPPDNPFERSRTGQAGSLLWNIHAKLTELDKHFCDAHTPEGQQRIEAHYLPRRTTPEEQAEAEAQAEAEPQQQAELENLW